MSTRVYCCFFGETNVSLSISAAFEASQISASIVYSLNLPNILDESGLQCSSVDIKVHTVTGFYISRMDFAVSYSLPSDILLGPDWMLLCKPVFIDNRPFILDPTSETAQALPHPHSWQPVNSSFLLLHIVPLA